MSETIKIDGTVMAKSYGYGTIAVTVISLLSLLGVLVLPLLSKQYNSYLILGLLALSVGTMIGDAFLHLIPLSLGLNEYGHRGHGPVVIRPNVIIPNLTTIYDTNGPHRHNVSDNHSNSEGGSTLPLGHDVMWKLLVVLGTIFFFHLMEVSFGFLQDNLGKKKGKAPSGYHHNHSHSALQISDHNHLVLMDPSKKNEETGSTIRTGEFQKNPERCGLETGTNGSLTANPDGSSNNRGSCFIGDLTTNHPSTLSKIKSNPPAKHVICPQSYSQAHEYYVDIVGLYDGLRVQDSTTPPTDVTKEFRSGKLEVQNVDNFKTNDRGRGNPVLLGLSNDGFRSSNPCVTDDRDQASICKAETCNAKRLELRYHGHRHDIRSCRYREILPASDIIENRKRELYRAQIVGSIICNNPLTSCPEKRLNQAKEDRLSIVPTTSHLYPQNKDSSSREKSLVKDASTTFGGGGGANESTRVSNVPGRNTGDKSLGGGVTGVTHNDSVFTTCPKQISLGSTIGVVKDNTPKQTISHDRVDRVKHKGPIGLPFCHGIESLSFFIILNDVTHNILDGIAIGVAFSSSLKEGLTTSFAVFCHEIPHELGDFAVLISTGISFKLALMINLFAACTSFVGLYISLSFAPSLAARQWIFAMTAGMFLYVSLADMLPELRENKVGSQAWSLFCQNLGIIVGVGIMLLVDLLF